MQHATNSPFRSPSRVPQNDLVCVQDGCDRDAQTSVDLPTPFCDSHLDAFILAYRLVLQEQRLRRHREENPGIPEHKVVQGRAYAGNGKYATTNHDSVVYYLQFGDRVKIGRSTNLPRRLTQLPHDRVLATEPGASSRETDRHLQFEKYRLVGEWFELSPELIEHCRKLRALMPASAPGSTTG